MGRRMSRTTEAFSRVKIDALLRDAGWDLTDGVSVHFECVLPDGTQSDYVLCDRSGPPHGGACLKPSVPAPTPYGMDQGHSG